MANTCKTALQKSLAWCQGAVALPGIRRRLYYISKSLIATWPERVIDATSGRLSSAVYKGSFTLVADAQWQYIDILPDKSQLTSESQGEYPSITQLNKLEAVHPGVEQDATQIAACLNNDEPVFLVEDAAGYMRVVGAEEWPVKVTTAQDNGQGVTGTTSTTISVEATDLIPSPFYEGTIETADGEVQAKKLAATA